MNVLRRIREVFIHERPSESLALEAANAEALAHAARALAKVPGMSRAVAEIKQLEAAARRHS